MWSGCDGLPLIVCGAGYSGATTSPPCFLAVRWPELAGLAAWGLVQQLVM